MQTVYTTGDYEVKQGRFLILSTFREDKYTEVCAQIVDGTDEAYKIAVSLQNGGSPLQANDSYSIHEGFIIVGSHDSRNCAQTLFAKTREEANESLTRFLADLNDY
jgi:hypothetical protein